ncbi:MAG: TRAP transporter small permease [Rhodovarius sp.]|nr:TRAP transporter small permease [Rhodovarius sp.]
MARRAGSAFDVVITVLNGFAAVLVLGLTALICADVVGRGLFAAPLLGVPEIVKTTMPILLWLQMAYAVRMGRMMRSGVGLRLMGRGPARMVLVLNAAIGTALFAVIGYGALEEFLFTWETGAWEGGSVRIPEWPAWLAVTVGASATALQYLRESGRFLREEPTEADLSGSTAE